MATLYFPPGIYIVKAPAIETLAILKLAKTNIKVCGDGIGVSTIKVADACPTHNYIIGPDPWTLSMTGLEICDLTFDHNIANNPITDNAEIMAWPEFTLGVFSGTSNVNIHDIEIINASSVNNIVLHTGTGHQIKDVIASVIGDDPNHVAHDASFIYEGTQGCIVDNVNLAAVIGGLGSMAGIEMHGAGYVVQYCTVADFRIGMNLAGIAPWASGGLVIANVITGCSTGLYLWSYVYPVIHESGYGIDGLTITGNDITLCYTNIPADSPVGIAFHQDWAHGTSVPLDVNDLHITSNTVTAPLETVPGAYTFEGCGIGRVTLNEDQPMTTLSNCTIIGNVITNVPVCGIWLRCNLDAVAITGNELTDCGSTLADADPVPTPIRIDGGVPGIVATDVEISGNTFVDDIPVTRIPYFIYIEAGAGSSGIVISGNDYSITGDKSGFIKHIEVIGDDAVPLITETIIDFVPPLGKVDPASTVIDGAYTWTVDATGKEWYKKLTGKTLLVVYPNAHPESTSVDGIVNLGIVYDDPWAVCRSAGGIGALDSGADNWCAWIKCSATTDWYNAWQRSIYLFDCSALPAGAVIDAANFSIQVEECIDNVGLTVAQKKLTLVAAAPGSDTALVAGDFNSLGAVRFAPDVIPVDYSRCRFDLNASGLAAVVDGITKLGLVLACDFDDDEPSWVATKYYGVYAYFTEKGTWYRPRLEISYHV